MGARVQRGDIVLTPSGRQAWVLDRVRAGAATVRLAYADDADQVEMRLSLVRFWRRPQAIARAPMGKRVQAALRTPASCANISAETGIPEPSVRAHLSVLMRRGVAETCGTVPMLDERRGPREKLYRLKQARA